MNGCRLCDRNHNLAGSQTPCHMPTSKLLDLTLQNGGRVSAIAAGPRRAESAFVFAHGAGAGMHHPFMAAVADGLGQRRIATLRYQFPSMEAGRPRVDRPPVAHATVRAAAAMANALWPGLPLFAGGKSFGGRMTSQAQAIEPIPGVVGLIFLGFPLHPSGKPSVERAIHLASIDVPMLFIHGERDALAETAEFDAMSNSLGSLASREDVAEADHAFHVPKRSGTTDDEVRESFLDALAVWTHAWRIRPSGPPGKAPK